MSLIIHLDSVCSTQTWSRPWWDAPHCPTCTCVRHKPKIEHGQYVECGYCHKIGILPDEGHEAEFTLLDAGTEREHAQVSHAVNATL
jgi:hypothetical protein